MITKNKILGIVFPLLLLVSVSSVFAQEKSSFEVDYDNPRKYVVGDVKVEGNTYFGPDQIVQLTNLKKGATISIPGEEISSAVKRLWLQKYFEDVAVSVDSLSAQGDTAFLKIAIKERPRVSRWTFSGIRNSEQKDLQERLNLKRGSEFSDFVETNARGVISRYFKKKGFQNVKIDVETKKDTMVKTAIRVNFNITKGSRVRIKKITFEGNEHVSDFKLQQSMKKTRDERITNFFHTKKFDEKEFPNDKKNLISKFNEGGYRDARIVKDTMYFLPPKDPQKGPNRLQIDFSFDEGKKYYFRNVTWTGNSVYTTDALNEILNIHKGDVYDVVTMEKRLLGGAKQNDMDVSKLYRDNGYLFFNVQPVELNIDGDSVDVEMRIVEGKPATLNNIIINGNDLTNERVVRRQVFTRPGYLFSQSDFERSIREIASMGQFDPEAISDPSKGYSIIPNQITNTVDLIYNVTEKPSSQLEISGGWGGNTFVGTVGVSFNNFSTRRILDKSAWRPVPLGDAQNLSLRFQTNGTYYTAISGQFVEPWLFGKKPTSLSVSLYFTRQTNSYIALGYLDDSQYMEVFGASAGIGKRLKWPDSYFVLTNQLSWQTYKLQDWSYGYFMFDTGLSNNFSYRLALSRNSTDQQIYPRQGSEFEAALQLTPPYSLLRHWDKGNLDKDGNPTYVDDPRSINYDNWSAQDRYRWIEYHKWTFKGKLYQKIVGDLVLYAGAQFGLLGYYNRNWGYSPFEGFLVGGDGMSGFTTYGADIIPLRGYENYSLTDVIYTPYSKGYTSYAGYIYDKFTVELRYPVVLQPQSTIYGLVFLEGGNCWSEVREFNPFQIKRSAGVGVRIYLPMIGQLGIDWGWGFDDATNGGSHFHFLIGQQF